MAYILAHATEIPEGLWVLHRCDNPPCVNPAHLFLGTPKDNTADKFAKGRANIATGDRHGRRTKPHCFPHGEQRNQAKLSNADVLEIRQRCARGESQAALAARFGVDPSLISRIKSRQAWGWL